MWGKGRQRVLAAIARRAITQSLPAIYTLCATCQVAVAEKVHWRSESSSVVATGSTYAETGLVWSPFSPLTAPGLQIRVSTGYGTWRERMVRVDVPKWHRAIGVGYRFSLDGVRGMAELGVNDTLNFGWRIERRQGVTARINLVWSPVENGFVSLDVRHDAAQRLFSASLSGGMPVPWGLKVGPDLGIATGADGTSLRAGLLVSNIHLWRQELAVAAGWRRDEHGRSGVYGSVWTARRF